MNTEVIWNFLTTQGADFGLKLLGAIAAWILGRWLIGLSVSLIGKVLQRGKHLDHTLIPYLKSIINVARTVVLVLRPYKVGNSITAGGVTGSVLTTDNVNTILGSNKIFSDNIQNFSTQPVRRVNCVAKVAIHRPPGPGRGRHRQREPLAGARH